MKNNHNAIDLQHLNQYTGGDLELEQEIYGLFKEQVRIWLRLLIADGDKEGWASAAHSLKGSARGLGANSLAAACERAEAVIMSGSAERSVAAQDVRDKVDAVLHFINKREYKLRIQSLRSSSQDSNS